MLVASISDDHVHGVGSVREQVLEIVRKKMPDLNCTSEESGFRIVAGSARSMGVEVID